jgi:hypothetical protein
MVKLLLPDPADCANYMKEVIGYYGQKMVNLLLL